MTLNVYVDCVMRKVTALICLAIDLSRLNERLRVHYLKLNECILRMAASFYIKLNKAFEEKHK